MAGLTPEVHPRVLDAGRPGEEDCVLIIEGQIAVLGARIDPVHVSATIRYKDTQEKEEDRAIVSIPGLEERHMNDRNGSVSSEMPTVCGS